MMKTPMIRLPLAILLLYAVNLSDVVAFPLNLDRRQLGLGAGAAGNGTQATANTTTTAAATQTTCQGGNDCVTGNGVLNGLGLGGALPAVSNVLFDSDSDGPSSTTQAQQPNQTTSLSTTTTSSSSNSASSSSSAASSSTSTACTGDGCVSGNGVLSAVGGGGILPSASSVLFNDSTSSTTASSTSSSSTASAASSSPTGCSGDGCVSGNGVLSAIGGGGILPGVSSVLFNGPNSTSGSASAASTGPDSSSGSINGGVDTTSIFGNTGQVTVLPSATNVDAVDSLLSSLLGAPTPSLNITSVLSQVTAATIPTQVIGSLTSVVGVDATAIVQSLVSEVTVPSVTLPLDSQSSALPVLSEVSLPTAAPNSVIDSILSALNGVPTGSLDIESPLPSLPTVSVAESVNDNVPTQIIASLTSLVDALPTNLTLNSSNVESLVDSILSQVSIPTSVLDPGAAESLVQSLLDDVAVPTALPSAAVDPDVASIISALNGTLEVETSLPSSTAVSGVESVPTQIIASLTSIIQDIPTDIPLDPGSAESLINSILSEVAIPTSVLDVGEAQTLVESLLTDASLPTTVASGVDPVLESILSALNDTSVPTGTVDIGLPSSTGDPTIESLPTQIIASLTSLVDTLPSGLPLDPNEAQSLFDSIVSQAAVATSVLDPGTVQTLVESLFSDVSIPTASATPSLAIDPVVEELLSELSAAGVPTASLDIASLLPTVALVDSALENVPTQILASLTSIIEAVPTSLLLDPNSTQSLVDSIVSEVAIPTSVLALGAAETLVESLLANASLPTSVVVDSIVESLLSALNAAGTPTGSLDIGNLPTIATITDIPVVSVVESALSTFPTDIVASLTSVVDTLPSDLPLDSASPNSTASAVSLPTAIVESLLSALNNATTSLDTGSLPTAQPVVSGVDSALANLPTQIAASLTSLVDALPTSQQIDPSDAQSLLDSILSQVAMPTLVVDSTSDVTVPTQILASLTSVLGSLPTNVSLDSGPTQLPTSSASSDPTPVVLVDAIVKNLLSLLNAAGTPTVAESLPPSITADPIESALQNASTAVLASLTSIVQGLPTDVTMDSSAAQSLIQSLETVLFSSDNAAPSSSASCTDGCVSLGGVINDAGLGGLNDALSDALVGGGASTSTNDVFATLTTLPTTVVDPADILSSLLGGSLPTSNELPSITAPPAVAPTNASVPGVLSALSSIGAPVDQITSLLDINSGLSLEPSTAVDTLLPSITLPPVVPNEVASLLSSLGVSVDDVTGSIGSTLLPQASGSDAGVPVVSAVDSALDNVPTQIIASLNSIADTITTGVSLDPSSAQSLIDSILSQVAVPTSGTIVQSFLTDTSLPTTVPSIGVVPVLEGILSTLSGTGTPTGTLYIGSLLPSVTDLPVVFGPMTSVVDTLPTGLPVDLSDVSSFVYSILSQISVPTSVSDASVAQTLVNPPLSDVSLPTVVPSLGIDPVVESIFSALNNSGTPTGSLDIESLLPSVTALLENAPTPTAAPAASIVQGTSTDVPLDSLQSLFDSILSAGSAPTTVVDPDDSQTIVGSLVTDVALPTSVLPLGAVDPVVASIISGAGVQTDAPIVSAIDSASDNVSTQIVPSLASLVDAVSTGLTLDSGVGQSLIDSIVSQAAAPTSVIDPGADSTLQNVPTPVITTLTTVDNSPTSTTLDASSIESLVDSILSQAANPTSIIDSGVAQTLVNVVSSVGTQPTSAALSPNVIHAVEDLLHAALHNTGTLLPTVLPVVSVVDSASPRASASTIDIVPSLTSIAPSLTTIAILDPGAAESLINSIIDNEPLSLSITAPLVLPASQSVLDNDPNDVVATVIPPLQGLTSLADVPGPASVTLPPVVEPSQAFSLLSSVAVPVGDLTSLLDITSLPISTGIDTAVPSVTAPPVVLPTPDTAQLLPPPGVLTDALSTAPPTVAAVQILQSLLSSLEVPVVTSSLAPTAPIVPAVDESSPGGAPLTSDSLLPAPLPTNVQSLLSSLGGSLPSSAAVESPLFIAVPTAVTTDLVQILESLLNSLELPTATLGPSPVAPVVPTDLTSFFDSLGTTLPTSVLQSLLPTAVPTTLNVLPTTVAIPVESIAESLPGQSPSAVSSGDLPTSVLGGGLSATTPLVAVPAVTNSTPTLPVSLPVATVELIASSSVFAFEAQASVVAIPTQPAFVVPVVLTTAGAPPVTLAATEPLSSGAADLVSSLVSVILAATNSPVLPVSSVGAAAASSVVPQLAVPSPVILGGNSASTPLTTVIAAAITSPSSTLGGGATPTQPVVAISSVNIVVSPVVNFAGSAATSTAGDVLGGNVPAVASSSLQAANDGLIATLSSVIAGNTAPAASSISVSSIVAPSSTQAVNGGLITTLLSLLGGGNTTPSSIVSSIGVNSASFGVGVAATANGGLGSVNSGGSINSGLVTSSAITSTKAGIAPFANLALKAASATIAQATPLIDTQATSLVVAAPTTPSAAIDGGISASASASSSAAIAAASDALTESLLELSVAGSNFVQAMSALAVQVNSLNNAANGAAVGGLQSSLNAQLGKVETSADVLTSAFYTVSSDARIYTSLTGVAPNTDILAVVVNLIETMASQITLNAELFIQAQLANALAPAIQELQQAITMFRYAAPNDALVSSYDDFAAAAQAL